ncbi:MAG: hypothetical protein JXB38_11905 [Anaerolineales bacterium]|nr:hypothetical protein [Anaerolineales bacterium]
MFTRDVFPELTGWDITRDTLHAYSKVLSAVRRNLVKPHPKHWHLSLTVTENGFSAPDIPFPTTAAEKFALSMNLKSHKLVLSTTTGGYREIGLAKGLSTAAFAAQVLNTLVGFNIQISPDPELLEDDTERGYIPEHAEAYQAALSSTNRIFKMWKKQLGEDTSPVQLWPNQFDLSLEWFGTKKVFYEENGKNLESQAQIGFGFSPGDSQILEPYFYANPWPFEREVTHSSLPKEARWYTESWEGSLMPYKVLVNHPTARELLLDYFKAVHEAGKASMTL